MSKLMLIHFEKFENSQILNSSSRKKLNNKKLSPRIDKLAKPKHRSPSDDDYVGPGSYSPNDQFLSTKSKSPSVKISKSSRFIETKLPPLRKNEGSKIDIREEKNWVLDSSPSYTFKRTGHNLKLVENPNFPGAGRYSPYEDCHDKGFTFYKAQKNFSWKKGKIYSVKIDKELIKNFLE